MADYDREQGESFPQEMVTKQRDMGDGTHAPVVAAVIVEGGSAVDVRRIPQTPTITAGAYVAGDALGDTLIFEDAVSEAGGAGLITKVVVVDNAGQNAPVDLVLFDQPFTPTADNAPFNPDPADLQNGLGYIDVAATDYGAYANNSEACKASGLRMPFEFTLDAVETSLRGQLVVRGTPTYVATDDLTVIITVERYA